MSVKRVARRARAERDIDEAAARYRAEGGSELELRFNLTFYVERAPMAWMCMARAPSLAGYCGVAARCGMAARIKMQKAVAVAEELAAPK